jgi:hypothetical protein
MQPLACMIAVIDLSSRREARQPHYAKPQFIPTPDKDTEVLYRCSLVLCVGKIVGQWVLTGKASPCPNFGPRLGVCIMVVGLPQLRTRTQVPDDYLRDGTETLSSVGLTPVGMSI